MKKIIFIIMALMLISCRENEISSLFYSGKAKLDAAIYEGEQYHRMEHFKDSIENFKERSLTDGKDFIIFTKNDYDCTYFNDKTKIAIVIKKPGYFGCADTLLIENHRLHPNFGTITEITTLEKYINDNF